MPLAVPLVLVHPRRERIIQLADRSTEHDRAPGGRRLIEPKTLGLQPCSHGGHIRGRDTEALPKRFRCQPVVVLRGARSLYVMEKPRQIRFLRGSSGQHHDHVLRGKRGIGRPEINTGSNCSRDVAFDLNALRIVNAINETRYRTWHRSTGSNRDKGHGCNNRQADQATGTRRWPLNMRHRTEEGRGVMSYALKLRAHYYGQMCAG